MEVWEGDLLATRLASVPLCEKMEQMFIRFY
jgi:hypothetical protein